MSPSDYLRLGLQLNAPISMLAGLWIAARWLPDLKTWLAQIGALSFISNRAGQLILWVALGVLFGSPVADWLGVLGTGVELLLFRAANMGSMSTVWGIVPFAVYSVIAILMTLAVYGLVVGIGYRQWPETKVEEEAADSSLALEEWFVLFAMASLVTRLVRGVVLNLIWLPSPALPNGYLQLVLQLFVPVSMIAGLWIGGRWMPAVTAALDRIGAQSFVSSRAGRVTIWLALGTLFGAPLVDLSGMVVTAFQLLLGPLANIGSVSTVWGTESVTGFNKIWILTTLVIYLVVGWIGYRLWPETEAAEPKGRSTLTVEQVFLLLAMTSVVNQFAQAFILGVIWLPVPNAVDLGRLSAVGFWGAWLLGLAVIAAILLMLLNSLRRHRSAG